jgi:hypothetical protein
MARLRPAVCDDALAILRSKQFPAREPIDLIWIRD